jgi:TP901 family phage tail tape measure protein
MSQVKIDFLVTGNMSSLHKQVQTLNAELMSVAGTMTAVDRSMSNIDLQSANAQFGRMLTTSGQFTQQMVTMRTSTDLFAEAIQRQNVTMRQAFTEARRYVTGRGGLVRDLAKQQVMMQNSVVMPHGVSPTGKVTASVVTPTGLDKDFATQMRVANKSWEVFNATAQQGATQMVNWGKNTQWAGRQLMVGFTVPLMIAGGLAARTFKELDEELVRLQKVYGSGFTFGDDFKKQSEEIRTAAIAMAHDMAQAYGQAGTETAALMADLAATGFEGEDLMKMTEQTTKLATLGEVDRQEAMKATVALQSAFKMSTDEVADSVLFLNAVENQTSASLNDLVEAIPRAGTVVEGLGGSVEDLALYMVAMREGGISAAEGANALKSGLSSIIAPPKAATEFMKEFGINLPKIVQENAGQLTPTLLAFQEQLKKLDDLARQQVITKLFGKYQFARMNAFFNNLGAQGSQTQKVFDLMGASIEDLGKLADQEAGAKAESVSGKWERAWEDFKINIAVIGEDLLKLGTMVVDIFNDIFGFVSKNEWLLNLVKYLGMAAAAIGPVIMLMGLFGNMLGMITKGGLRLVNMFKVLASGGGIGKTFEVLTAESFQADTAVEQLTGSMYEQKTAQEVLTQAVKEYTLALEMLQSQARSTSTAVSAMNITDPLMADKYTRLMGAQPRAKTKGVLLGTEANNQGRNRAGIANYTPAELSKMSPQQLARMGLVMRMIETGGVTIPGVSGNSTTAASSALTAAKGGAPEAWNDMVVRAVNDPSVQAAYAKEFASAENNPGRYAAQLVAREMRLQTEKSMQSGNLGPRLMALNAVAASAVMPGQTAPANLDATKFKALTSNETLSVLAAAGDKLAAELEHLIGKTQTVEDAMTMITSMEKEYGLNLEDLKASVLKRANTSDKIGLTEDELASVLARFNQNVNEANAWMEKVTAEVSEFVGNVNGLNANGVDRLEKAMMEAALKVEGVTFTEVTAAGKRYAVALDQAGNVIKESSFLITDAGGTASLAAKSNAKHLDDLNAALADTTGSMQVEEKQRRSITDAIVVDETATRAHSSATELDTAAEVAEVGANEASASSEYREVTANNASAASEMAGAAAPAGGGIMNYMKNNKSMMAGGALMGGAMMGSMLLPQGPASNIANMTMMGAGVGGMFGPWGLAIGGIAGLAVGGITEIFKKINADAAEELRKAEATWDQNFSSIDLNVPGLKEMGIDIKNDVTMDLTMPSGMPVEEVDESRVEALKEMFSKEIETIRDGTDSVGYTQRILAELIRSGVSPEEARGIIYEIMSAAGKTSEFVEVMSADIDTVSKAIKFIDDSVKSQVSSAFQTVGTNNAVVGGIGDVQLTPGQTYSAATAEANLEAAAKSGVAAGTAYADGFENGMQSGAIKNTGDISEYYKTSLDKIAKDAAKTISEEAAFTARNVELLAEQGISVEGKSVEEVLQEIIRLGPDAREALLGNNGLDPQFANTVTAAEQASITLAHSLRDSLGPEFKSIVADAEEAAGAVSAVDQAIVLAEIAARTADMSLSFGNLAQQYMNTTGPTSADKVNIAQLERQQSREMELMQEHEQDKLDALQEAEDERLEQMQRAAEKRENAIQKEINQVEREYNKEIAAIQRAEEKRQEAFANEEERAQKRQEMRNMQISYEEAIATGQLFEAARIRMDIKAIRKQEESQSRAEKSQEKSDKKVKILEKEKNEKIRILNKELRAEQRANEKAIEAAQEASEAKIEAAQEASEAAIEAAERQNRKEIKLAEDKNKKIAENEEDAAADSKKLFDLLIKGRMKDFREEAKALGINAKERSALISDFVAKQFGFLPDKLYDSVSSSIMNGNWDLLQKLMKGKIEGMSNKELADLASWKSVYDDPGGSSPGSGNPATSPTGMATGGFVSGPGSGTSDSIPAKLSNGEYVIKAAKVQKYGKSFFDKLNGGHNVGGAPGSGAGQRGYAKGGIVWPVISSGILKPAGQAMAKVVKAEASKRAEAARAQVDQFGGMKSAPTGDRVYWDGEPIDQLVAKQLKIAGRLLGQRFSVTQGSYQEETSYSGTSHMGGGTIDTPPYGGMYGPGVRALQRAGFAAWWRGPQHGDWEPHIHAISLFSPNPSPTAAWQRQAYIDMSSNGLSGSSPYYGPHLAPIPGLKNQLGLRSGGRINYDNTIANLHKGETVLTKTLSDKLEDNIANLGGNEYNFDVTIENLSSEVDLERAFERFVVKHERKQQVRSGRSRRI